MHPFHRTTTAVNFSEDRMQSYIWIKEEALRRNHTKGLGSRLYTGIARQRPVALLWDWLVLGLRPAVESGGRSDTKSG